jgi:hypothetical protein
MPQNPKTLAQEVKEHLMDARVGTPWGGLDELSEILIDPANPVDVGNLLTLHGNIINKLELICEKFAFEFTDIRKKLD